jgi:hypothetical protein
MHKLNQSNRFLITQFSKHRKKEPSQGRWVPNGNVVQEDDLVYLPRSLTGIEEIKKEKLLVMVEMSTKANGEG